MITLTDIHKSFGDTPVMRGVTLTAERGENLAIVGGSGSGKSVLLKCILGLETPDSGSIAVGGVPLTAKTRPTFLNDFGMLFQSAALFDSLPLWQNVAFRLLHTGMPQPKARDIALRKLARVGLGPETADRYPAELSGGMQKRAGLARAIATDPSVIFFDEPTTGLDPIRARTINALIRDIVAEAGATTITITHDMSTVRTTADRVALLHEGQIAWHGAVADMDAAQSPQLKHFMMGPVDAIGTDMR